MKMRLLLAFVPFLLGLIMSQAINGNVNLEMPFSDGLEVMSPSDWVKESQIFVYDDRVVLNVENAYLAGYANTNSMDPLLDERSNGIEMIPKSEDDLNVGDVIVYETDIGLIVHRIVEISADENGKYFILKGDNNSTEDPYRVRFNQIRYVLVGVIY